MPIFLGKQEGTAAGTESAAVSGIDPDATEWDGNTGTAEGMEESTEITVPAYPCIIITGNGEPISVALVNPEGNTCYFTYSIILDGEVLYESGLIPPGQAVIGATLSRDLEAGEYEATVRLVMTSADDGSETDSVDIATTLYVD